MIIDDVMKGNWISYKKIPHMINKIMGDDVVLSNHYSSDGGEYITGISECEPIKLTKDVLIECGFYEIKEKFVLDSGNNMIFLTCNGDGDFMLSVALCDMHMKVEYIHQLQQILKVFGYKMLLDLNNKNSIYKVGNFVRYKNEIYYIESINHTENKYMLTDCNSSENGLSCSINEIEPVSITNELMEYNGFVYKETDNYYIKNNESSEYYISYNNEYKWKLMNNINNKSYTGYIQFFNQLQNISEGLDIKIDWNINMTKNKEKKNEENNKFIQQEETWSIS